MRTALCQRARVDRGGDIRDSLAYSCVAPLGKQAGPIMHDVSSATNANAIPLKYRPGLTRAQLLAHLRLDLMSRKGWHYLRYLHLRDAVARVAGQIESICICGAGRGTAELAVWLEFPHLKMVMTDHIDWDNRYPSYHYTMNICWRSNLSGIEFGVWDVLGKSPRQFDMVCSTEMLEHIEDRAKAVANMSAAARHFIYCLVPFADAASNANERRRQYVFEKHQHFVCGFDADEMTSMFPNPILLAGTYWRGPGGSFRDLLAQIDKDDIPARFAGLETLALQDLSDRIPTVWGEAEGIKILSRRALVRDDH